MANNDAFEHLVARVTLSGVEVWACPGSKAAGSGFPLQVRALITGLAGFPLQSVTRNARTYKAIRTTPRIGSDPEGGAAASVTA